MTQTYNVLAMSEAVSPLSHMSGVTGNEAIIARENVITPRGVLRVPVLSGNAIRHRCVRAPGWRWLIGQWGLEGKLGLAQLNYCFHGGNLTEGGGREDTRRIADLQRLMPLARLLGGSLPDQIISGSLIVWRGRLICEENREHLKADLAAVGWELPDVPLRPAEAFVSDAKHNQYVRGDAAQTAPDLLPSADGNGERQRGQNVDGSSNLMIFSGQAVTRGACFLHGFTLQYVSELELGALLLSLRLWQAVGGTVGGQGARGHGRLQTWLHLPDGVDSEACVSVYAAHVEANRDEAVAWLNAAFAPRRETKTRKAKKAEAATDA